MLVSVWWFFFFQAEDGIRDVAVTGVQTCALPICIRGHPVPESRRQGWRAGFDDRMEPLAQGAIRFPHRGDLREHGAFRVRLGRLQLSDALLHRGSFLVRECALDGLLRALLCG